MFTGGRHRVAQPHRVEEVHFLARAAKDLSRDADTIARVDLSQMADVGFGGEKAAAGRDVGGVAADQFHEPVCGVGERVEIPRFGHVTVLVGPVERDLAVRGFDRLRGVEFEVGERFVGLGQVRPRPLPGLLEPTQDRHKVAVADAFEITD